VLGITILLATRKHDEAEDEEKPENQNTDKPATAESIDGEPDAPSVMRTELPFGPFLAMAAVFYLFAEPWIQLNFNLLGG